ncbi:MAG: flagellar hook-basal body complex protein [Pseudomonadota bacterium]|nr:flagellar hook-basal body complex protein [Pseudomonadota bacterium]
MPIYGIYSAPTLGMIAQTSAFGSISQNVSNMHTGGYKAHDTRFATVLASQVGNAKDIGGTISQTRDYIEKQGRVMNTKNPLDLAIDGKGLFVLNTKADGTGDTLYTRDGAFQKKAGETTQNLAGQTYNKGYLVDKNGHYLQGWAADNAGAISTTGALSSIRIDTDAFGVNGPAAAQATSTAQVGINLPITLEVLNSQTVPASIIDANGDTQTFDLVWTRNRPAQNWTMTVNPSDATSTSTSTGTVTFNEEGRLAKGTTIPITITTAAGLASTFTLDVSDVTSLGQAFTYLGYQRDGRAAGELDSFHFDNSGKIVGEFTNGHQATLYKLPLATFTNANKLDRLTGNVFERSVDSGEATLREIRTENPLVTDIIWEFASFMPEYHELSNVDLQNQFTYMIMSQQAYNSSATVFKSVDEMTKMAASLKT